MSSNYFKFPKIISFTTHYFSSHCRFIEASSVLDKPRMGFTKFIHDPCRNEESYEQQGHQLYMPTGSVSPILTSQVKHRPVRVRIFSSFIHHSVVIRDVSGYEVQ